VAKGTLLASTADTGPYFTMMMVNPDRNEPLEGVNPQPGRHDYVHWMVTNLTASSEDQTRASTLVEYMPPNSNPPLAAGVDRYSILFFEHNASHVVRPTSCSNMKCVVGEAGGTDPRWINTTSFVEQHKLGGPVSGLIFRSGRGGARRLLGGSVDEEVGAVGARTSWAFSEYLPGWDAAAPAATALAAKPGWDGWDDQNAVSDDANDEASEEASAAGAAADGGTDQTALAALAARRSEDRVGLVGSGDVLGGSARLGSGDVLGGSAGQSVVRVGCWLGAEWLCW
jgi:hypothetical protein